MPSDAAAKPTFTYRGQNFLWGYSPDRQICGLWSVEDPTGSASQTWPISEHEAAWRVFRSLEPHAIEYAEAAVTAERSAEGSPESSASVEKVVHVDQGSVASEGVLAKPVDASRAVASDVSEFVSPTARLRRLAVVALVSVVVAVAAVLGVLAFSPGPSTPSANAPAVEPGQAVLTAATTTEHQNTAEMSMTETVTVGSKTVTVPASGVVDFADGAGSISMTVEGEHFTAVSDDGDIYMNVPEISQVLPGKSWVFVPATSSGSAAGGALGGGDPAQMLQFLASKGNIVTLLGPTTMGGVPVQEYSVIVDKSAVQSALEGSGLPAQIVQSADQFLQSVGAISFKVYVDSANQLRGIDFSMSVPGSPGGTLSARMTFSDFGVPVSVAVPPTSQVASLQQFLDAAQQAVAS